MNLFVERRARVRPEFAWLYPEIARGVWLSASRVARHVQQRGLRSPGAAERACNRGRVLNDAHFEFRGGRRSPQELSGVWTARAALRAG